MKRMICLVLACVLLCAVIAPVSAANGETATPYFTYIRSITATFDIDSYGVANCYAKCQTISGYTIKIVGSLQQYNSNKWKEIYSWTTTGTTLVILDRDRAVYSGYNYRFVAKVYIYDAEGTFLESSIATRYYDYT